MIPVTFEEFTALAMKAPSIQAQTAAGFVRVEVPAAIHWAREYTEPDRKRAEGLSFFMSEFGIIIGGDSHYLVQRKEAQ